MEHGLMNQEIRNCIDVLRKGGTILYPTDTIWGIGCDATNPRAVQKVFKIKKRMESKSMIVLLDQKEKLDTYVETIPPIALDLLENIQTPLTIIYPNAKNLAKNIIAGDGTIAIRVVHFEFCYRLVRMFGKPVVSTSANIAGQTPPLMFRNIPEEILQQVDYTVNLYREEIHETKPSTIIKVNTLGEFEIIRK